MTPNADQDAALRHTGRRDSVSPMRDARQIQREIEETANLIREALARGVRRPPDPTGVRRGIWLRDPFDLRAGWHVLVNDGRGKPKPGQVVRVTRRNGTVSDEVVVAPVAVFQKLPQPPTVWYLCRVTATEPDRAKHTYPRTGVIPRPRTEPPA